MTFSKGMRNAQIEKERIEGATFQHLSEKYGVSPERIRQLILKLERNRRYIAERLEAPLATVK